MANPNLPAAGSGLKTQNAVSVDSSKSPGAVMGGGASAKPTATATTTSAPKVNGGGGSANSRTTNVNMADGGGRAGATTTSTGGPSADKLAQVEANYQKQQNPPPGPGGGTGGGGSSPSGGSSSPSVDTSYDPYAAGNAAAADTVNRITQGVDMTEQINNANNAWQQATQNYGEQSGQILGNYEQSTHAGLNEYQQNAQGIIDQLSNLTGQQLADYANQTGQTIQQATDQINSILQGLQDNLKPVNAGRVGNVDITEQQNILQEMTNNQRQQAENQINYAVQQGVNELQRAQEDAQPQFQTQRNQIAAQERQAQDNQALYSEMRGDRGGVGQAQYNAIQNAAATNQLKVNQQQTKLATDTARQIADLRAQGEFDTADKYLEISQEYLGKLMQLKQWADEANISIDEFNIGVEQWEQEYNAKLQETLGQLGIEATQYQTGLNLDRQQYLTNQGLNAANTNAQQNLSLQGNVQQQRQQLNDALASYGLSNAQYMTNSDINRLTTALNAYMQNAQNMASTELSAANVFGASSEGTLTSAQREAQQQQLAAAAQQMIASGITPTDAQLKGLGWSRDQYNSYKSLLASASSGGGGGGKRDTFYTDLQDAIENGLSYEAAMQAINQAEASGKHTDKIISDSRTLVEKGNKNGLLGKVS